MSSETVSARLVGVFCCCGVNVLGDFANEEQDDDVWSDYGDIEYFEASSKTSRQRAWEKLLAKVRKSNDPKEDTQWVRGQFNQNYNDEDREKYKKPSVVIMLNFVKQIGMDKFDYHEFMEVVEAQPDVKLVAEWVNSNTTNIIRTYMLMGNV